MNKTIAVTKSVLVIQRFVIPFTKLYRLLRKILSLAGGFHTLYLPNDRKCGIMIAIHITLGEYMKKTNYNELCASLEALVSGVPHTIANLANDAK